jgi:hypothetical protein
MQTQLTAKGAQIEENGKKLLRLLYISIYTYERKPRTLEGKRIVPGKKRWRAWGAWIKGVAARTDSETTSAAMWQTPRSSGE